MGASLRPSGAAACWAATPRLEGVDIAKAPTPLDASRVLLGDGLPSRFAALLRPLELLRAA